MASEKTAIYHERQKLQFCLLHSLSNLFQYCNRFVLDDMIAFVPVCSVPSAPVDFLPSSNNFKPLPLLPPRLSASTNYVVLPGVSGPSAPVDYTPYDQKIQKQFGGLNLEEEEVNSNPMEKKPENNEFVKREGIDTTIIVMLVIIEVDFK
ncbi:hypothetical protein EZV62_002850 [Acer yangbiense]|uniref:ubiquitinyl hydrolase 1 n=1 Tax=Acer yangbiense TaxID=1000413 RepID=A0A5C7IYG8_9ROSI|nr:hypothetical protein EZV62_002850 [Acer yangbiense]